MSKNIINLTSLLVVEKFQDILANYPQTPYRELLAKAELKNQIINQVLSQIPEQFYTIVNESEKIPKNISCFCFCTEEQRIVEELIHQTILDLLQFQRDKTLHSPALEDNPFAKTTMNLNQKLYYLL